MEETLILIQTLINNIEDTTLDIQYHSKFNYLNDHEMKVESFCWKQTSTYKNLFETMKNVITYIEANNIIRFYVIR